MAELGELLQNLAAKLPKGLVVYSAKSSGFIAGADIKEFTGLKTPEEAFQMIRRGQLVMEQLEQPALPHAWLSSTASVWGVAWNSRSPAVTGWVSTTSG